MKTTRDPVRLVDEGSEAPGYVRAALEAARGDGPRPDQLERLARRLPHGGGSGPVPPAAPPGVPAAARPAPGVLGKALAVILALLGGGALFLSLKGSPLPAVPPPPPPEPAESAVAAPVEQPFGAPPASAASAVAIEAPAPSVSATPRAAPRTTASAAGAPGMTASSAAEEGESEIRLLQRAQDALGSSPARALQIANEHIARFPRGVLAQEREVIAISALTALGRTSEARARAARFLAAYPRSAHRRRLEVLIGDSSHKEAQGAPPSP